MVHRNAVSAAALPAASAGRGRRVFETLGARLRPTVLGVLLALGALLTLAGTAPAAAEGGLAIEKLFGTVRGWQVGFSSSVGGCVAAATYRDETTVWIGFGDESSPYIAFTNPKWRSIQVKSGYDLRIETRRTIWNGRFYGFDRGTEKGIFTTDLKAEFLGEFADSAGIKVVLNRAVIAQLSLDGSRAALGAIITCQKSFLEAAAKGGTTPERSGRGREEAEDGGSKSGTGFFVSKDGHVLTNQHVVEGCRRVKIAAVGQKSAGADIVARDKINDLALLKTTAVPIVVPGFRAQPRLGEPVSVFGFPLSEILSSSGNFTIGSVTALAGLGDDTRMVQISAPVQPGNSGGPLIDKYGNVIGVIVSKLNALGVAAATRDIAQNVNFAIKAAIALNFLAANGVVPAEASTTREIPPEAAAELAKTFTVRITCD